MKPPWPPKKERALERSLTAGALDVTLPGRPTPRGRLHISTQTLRDIYAIFADLGFQIYRSPEVEDDETNFGLLNMPPHHPARDMWDTFHTTKPGVLLRTHTSPGQIHVMRAAAARGRSASSCRACATATRPSRRAARSCSIRSRGWSSASA